MNQHKNTFRLTALLTVVAIILGIYVFRLQNVQIAQAKAAKNVRTDTYTYYTRVTAARGETVKDIIIAPNTIKGERRKRRSTILTVD